MKRIIWSILLVSAYVWSTATGRDQFVFTQGKRIYQAFTTWFQDAEIDFHVETPPEELVPQKKKRPRRWD